MTYTYKDLKNLITQKAEFETCDPYKKQLLLLDAFISSTEIREYLKTAPASTAKSKHHATESGLVTHIMEMISLAEPMTLLLDHLVKSGNFSNIDLSELVSDDGKLEFEAAFITCCVLHDISKAVDINSNKYYVPNLLKSGKVSDAKPYSVNKEFLKDTALALPKSNMGLAQLLFNEFNLSVDDGKVSLAMVKLLCPELYETLTESQKQAIVYHSLGYGSAKYEITGAESYLTILLHLADMFSSRFTEHTTRNE